jgi:DNA-binding MarR family transcriptional regulator
MKIEKFLSQSLVFGLIKAGNEIEKLMMEELSSHDLNLNQALILTSIFFEGKAVQPIQLANSLQMTKANVSHCLASLEEKKYVKRNSKSQDRRIFEIDLTDAGTKKISSLVEYFEKQQQGIENKFGEKNLERVLIQILEMRQMLSARETVSNT